MKTRPLRISEVNVAVEIDKAAWLNDPSNAYLAPNRRRHPRAFHAYLAHMLKQDLHHQDENTSIIAVETERIDEEAWTGRAEIVGYATFAVEDENAKSPVLRRTRNFIKMRIHDLYELLNPAISLRRGLSYGNKEPEYFDRKDCAPDKCIFISHISVNPEHQGKGFGLFVIQEILRRAKEAGLPVLLYSTLVGEKLYRKAGFRQIGTWECAKGQRPLAVMKWDLSHEKVTQTDDRAKGS